MHRTLLPLTSALALLLNPARAQQSLMPFLPEDTVMAISVPNLDASIGRFAEMPLAKIWREEEVQKFFADAKNMAKARIDAALEQARQMRDKGAFPVDPDKLLTLRVHGGTFAMTKLRIVSTKYSVAPEFGMLLHLDFGDTAEQWHGMIKMGLDLLAQHAGDDVVREETKVGDTTIVQLSPKEAPAGTAMAINVAMVKNGVLIGTLKSDVATALENMQKGKHVLAATDRYKAIAKHLQTEGAEVEMFARTDAIFDFLLQALTVAAEHDSKFKMVDIQGVGRAIDALGVRSLQAVGATSAYKGGKAISSSYTSVPEAERKGFLVGANKKLDLGFLHWVPKDAVGFSAWTMDPGSIYDGCIGALRAYDEAKAKQWLGELAGIEKKIGFSIRDDFIGAIGDTAMWWHMPISGAMAPPETAFLLKVNDDAKMVKVLKSLCTMSEGKVTLEESDKRGVKSYQFHLNIDPMPGMSVNVLESFNPSFAFKNGYLVAGFNTGDIRRVFQRMDRKDDEPKNDIRGNKEFAVYAEQVPADIQSLSFTDWKAQLEGFYQLITTVLAFVPTNEDIPFDPQLLPEVATLTKHMFGSLSYERADATGFTSTSISPFGPEMIVPIAALIGGVAGAAATMARHR